MTLFAWAPGYMHEQKQLPTVAWNLLHLVMCKYVRAHSSENYHKRDLWCCGQSKKVPTWNLQQMLRACSWSQWSKRGIDSPGSGSLITRTIMNYHRFALRFHHLSLSHWIYCGPDAVIIWASDHYHTFLWLRLSSRTPNHQRNSKANLILVRKNVHAFGQDGLPSMWIPDLWSNNEDLCLLL